MWKFPNADMFSKLVNQINSQIGRQRMRCLKIGAHKKCSILSSALNCALGLHT